MSTAAKISFTGTVAVRAAISCALSSCPVSCPSAKASLAATGSYAQICGIPGVIDAAATIQLENAAIVWLPFAFEGQRAVRVGRAVDQIVPTPEVNASGHSTYGLH
jgi:hypothetical protein